MADRIIVVSKTIRTRKRYVQDMYLSAGFGDFGIYHDAFACMGVWCDSDD